MTPSSFVREALDLCRLRGAPENLPHSPRLLVALLVASTGLDVLVGESVEGEALAQSLLGSVVVLGLCALALAIRRLSNRYVQTATALLACGIVFTLAQWPVAWLMGPLPEAPGDASPPSPRTILLMWVSLALLAWQVLVYARIVRCAMDATMPFAVALVVTWLVAFWALDGLLLGT